MIYIVEITSQEEGSAIQWMSSVEAKIEDKKIKRENKLTSGKLENLRKEKVRKILASVPFLVNFSLSLDYSVGKSECRMCVYTHTHSHTLL